MHHIAHCESCLV